MERNEVLFRELLRLGRTASFYVLRSIPPLAIGGLLLVLSSLDSGSQAGIESFEWIVVGFNIFTFAAMSLLVSGVLAEEWQSNTLSVLVLADTSVGAILRGILGSRVLVVLANLCACLPLFVAIMSFGGVGKIQMFQFSGLLVSLTVFYGAFSLLASSVVKKREMSLLLSFLIIGLPQLVSLYVVERVQALPWLAWSPAVAMKRLTEHALPWTWSMHSVEGGNRWGASGNWLILNVGLLLCAAVFVWLARRTLVSGADLSPGRSQLKAAKVAEFKPIVGNPISWLVLKRFDPLLGVPKAFALSATCVLAIGFEVWDTFFMQQPARDAVALIGFVVMAWTFLWACLVSAQMWMEERTERTLELLLATPYTRDEVILWKVDALFWALIVPTAMYSLLLPAKIWSSVALGSIAMRVFLIIPFTMCCFLYSYVGLFVVVYVTIFFSIRASSAVHAVLATLGSIGGVVFLHVLAFVVGGSSAAGLIGLVVVFDVVLIAAFVPAFRSRLHRFELR